jgi:glutathione synthase/RimK-type ligase-like ATP-grasp enzyme
MIILRNKPSKGARALSRATGIGINRPGTAPRAGTHAKVINWGCTELEVSPAVVVYNKPANVALAVNKKLTFAALAAKNVPIVPVLTELPRTRVKTYFARDLLSSSQGRGIRVIRPEDPYPETAAPLYTQYIKPSNEYRVHVAFGKVIAVQEKKKRREVERTDDGQLIRNLANGWVFAVNEIRPIDPQGKEVAINGVKALGLDFGAVDMIFSRDGSYLILEINTAPGLSAETTLEAYKTAFNEVRENGWER